MANEILTFCPTSTGSNLLTQSEYAAASDRTNGNQPGVASSKLVNKALRQTAFMASQLAQYVTNKSGSSVVDDGDTAALLAQIVATFNKAPTVQKFISGSGTYTRPTPAPLYIRVRLAGGGGGGAGSGTAAAGSGGDGGDTTFGTALLSGGKGLGAVSGTGDAGVGGSASLGSGPVGLALAGGAGSPGGVSAVLNQYSAGGSGGVNTLGGAGGGGKINNPPATSGITNTGGGGGGAGSGSAANDFAGGGGGAGGYVDAIITSPASTYAYAVGAAGAAGAAGTNGYAGTAGGSGVIIVEEYYS